MPRKTTSRSNRKSALQRAGSAAKRLFSRGRGGEADVAPSQQEAQPRRSQKKKPRREPQRAARPAKREADIPLDVLERTYTPADTSAKAGFRSTGADHQRDQEFATGVADERWNDEDRLTNKSGDPRIGTHRRTYEPGEARAEENNR